MFPICVCGFASTIIILSLALKCQSVFPFSDISLKMTDMFDSVENILYSFNLLNVSSDNAILVLVPSKSLKDVSIASSISLDKVWSTDSPSFATSSIIFFNPLLIPTVFISICFTDKVFKSVHLHNFYQKFLPNFYEIFTKFLRNFYEIFTKFLRNFYENFSFLDGSETFFADFLSFLIRF